MSKAAYIAAYLEAFKSPHNDSSASQLLLSVLDQCLLQF